MVVEKCITSARAKEGKLTPMAERTELIAALRSTAQASRLNIFVGLNVGEQQRTTADLVFGVARH
jgi:hypothetical protein